MVNVSENSSSDGKRINSFYWAFAIPMLVLIVIFFVLFSMPGHSNQAEVFFIETVDYMGDYNNVIEYSEDGDPYFFGVDTSSGNLEDYYQEENGSAEQAYFPLAYVIFGFLSKLASYQEPELLSIEDVGIVFSASSLLLAVSSVFMTFLTLLLFWELSEESHLERGKKAILMLALFFSGIFLFAFERGNIVILSVICTVFYLANYRSENRLIRELSFISLAIAAALKGYPALLGILLLYEKRWKEAVRTIIYGIVFAIGPFFLLGGLAVIPRWLNNFNACTQEYLFGQFPRFGYLYYLSYFLSETVEEETLYALNTGLSIVTWILALLTLASASAQKVQWKKYLSLLSLIILLPSNSGLYCGLYLFFVIILFFNEKNHEKWEIVYVILFIVFLNPLQLNYNDDISITKIGTNAAQYLLFFMVLAENLCACGKLMQSKRQMRQAMNAGTQKADA